MPTRLMRVAASGLLGASLLLTGCGEINVRKYIPFTGDAPQERSRTPASATEYKCNGGKRFFVRTLDGGAAVWLILPEREVRLNRLGAGTGAGLRYSNGSAVLDINGNEATLNDGATTAFAGCKAASSQP